MATKLITINVKGATISNGKLFLPLKKAFGPVTHQAYELTPAIAGRILAESKGDNGYTTLPEKVEIPAKWLVKCGPEEDANIAIS